jgi:uncharacterized protein DUF541
MNGRRAVTVAMLGMLSVPGTALAQTLSAEPDAPPGITITGIGFARLAAPGAAQPTAVGRAVRDARRRAAAIAAEARVQPGQVTEVELQDTFQQFGGPRPALFAAAAATVTFSIVDGAGGSDEAREVSAYGSASAPVEPRNPRGNRSIRRAVLAARLAVTPRAAAAALRNARIAAGAAGLEPGGIVSISEQREPYFYEVALGSFGPARFCGIIRRSIFRRDPDTGRSRLVRRVRRRRCNFPRPYALRLEATYEAR